jgi:hypothetical protein
VIRAISDRIKLPEWAQKEAGEIDLVLVSVFSESNMQRHHELTFATTSKTKSAFTANDFIPMMHKPSALILEKRKRKFSMITTT